MGFQLTELAPSPLARENAVRELARVPVLPGVCGAFVSAVAVPGSYVTLLPVIVSAAVPPPVVKAALSATVAVQVVPSWERWSLTVTTPIEPVADPPGAAEESEALPGALMVRPVVAVTVKVVTVSAAVEGVVVAMTTPIAATEIITPLRTCIPAPPTT
ncbi:hypothetical protein [Streptomyces sp. NPDC054794]